MILASTYMHLSTHLGDFTGRGRRTTIYGRRGWGRHFRVRYDDSAFLFFAGAVLVVVAVPYGLSPPSWLFLAWLANWWYDTSYTTVVHTGGKLYLAIQEPASFFVEQLMKVHETNFMVFLLKTDFQKQLNLQICKSHQSGRAINHARRFQMRTLWAVLYSTMR